MDTGLRPRESHTARGKTPNFSRRRSTGWCSRVLVLLVCLLGVVLAVLAQPIWSIGKPSCTCPLIACPDVSLPSDECTDPASFTMLNIRSSHIPPMTVRLSIELRSDGPAFGAKAIDRRLGLINSRALSLHDLILHHTAQFHRLQTTTATAMSDTCSKICRPYRSWKFWKNHNTSTFLSPDVHNTRQDQVVLDHLQKTVRDAARIYHDNVASSLASGIQPLNDSLGNAIFEAYEAWTKPLPSEVCHEIFAASCDATDYYKEKPQITWMNQFFVALKGEQDALSMSKHDLDHYLAAVDPQAWTNILPAHTKDMDVEDKTQWVWKVGKQVRQGVSIGSADMKPHVDNGNNALP